jgi:porin
VLACSLAIGWPGPERARAAASETPTPSAGGWGGLRARLASHGLVFEPALLADAFLAPAGGRRKGGALLANFDLPLTLRLGPLAGWSGATLLLRGMAEAGRDPSTLVGDAQGVSSIAAPDFVRLYEAWIQQELADGRVSLLLGRYDLNSEFYALESAALFLNSSLGIGAAFAHSGMAGPSIYPDTALGARLGVRPGRHVALRVAVLDAAPLGTPGERLPFSGGDGLLLVGEADLLLRLADVELPGAATPRAPRFRPGRAIALGTAQSRLALGAWRYTGRFPDLASSGSPGAPATRAGSSGAYAIGEGTVWSGSGGRRWMLFAQAGVADPRVNRFVLYLGAGAVLEGAIRADDRAGFALAAARNGGPHLESARQAGAPALPWEIALEWTYQASIRPGLALQPDVQWVIHPGTDPNLGNALAVALRLLASL